MQERASQQEPAKPTKMKAPSLELRAARLLLRHPGFPGSPQHQRPHLLPLVLSNPIPPFKENPGSRDL